MVRGGKAQLAPWEAPLVVAGERAGLLARGTACVVPHLRCAKARVSDHVLRLSRQRTGAWGGMMPSLGYHLASTP